MKCLNCGEVNKEQNQFCSECGTKLSEQNAGKVGKKSKKKVIVLATAMVILIAGISIFYQIGKANSAPENVVQAFEDAVENNDPDKIQSMLTSSNESLSINMDNTSNFVEFLEENAEVYENLIHKLNDQAEAINQNVTPYNSDGDYGTLHLAKDGKQWLFFDDYKLEVTPMYIELATETDEIDLAINGEKVTTSSQEDTFGPYMPGTHVVRAGYANEYTSTEVTDEITTFDSAEDTVRHEIELPLTEVSITSTYDDYKLFVNGEQTDIDINEGENPIGTFPSDSSTTVHIQKEFPWGNVKSEEEPISSDAIRFDEVEVFTQDEKTALMEQINESISLFHEALTERDESILQAGVTDNLEEILSEHMESTGDWSDSYEGELKKAEYDISRIIYPEYNEDLKGYTIILKAHYYLYEPEGHAYGNLNWLGRDEDKQQYKASKDVTLFYDESESAWKLHNIENEYFHISDFNSQEFIMDE
ncbi:putative membrane protein YvbJ [Virgibacillus natechei]|uniref:Membrane protein YvbJ n=1 Tax=Virgibacillus natechei TaxID=1216297 RepID=A0ABS4ICN7_9BACI|nr:hypothetical protein [Virgibacillus natechei]MBP1968655.1 putative membrane protein YvbJ [Virgibacillus natechei]UZD13759.1 hypothetical protein OLD84_04185 [Virgibacillus natechei]